MGTQGSSGSGTGIGLGVSVPSGGKNAEAGSEASALSLGSNQRATRTSVEEWAIIDAATTSAIRWKSGSRVAAGDVGSEEHQAVDDRGEAAGVQTTCGRRGAARGRVGGSGRERSPSASGRTVEQAHRGEEVVGRPGYCGRGRAGETSAPKRSSARELQQLGHRLAEAVERFAG